MEILVLLLPVILLVPLGLLIGAALTHYVAAWLPLVLAGGLGVLAVVLIWVGRQATSGFDGIGNVILATLFAAPSALGLVLGAAVIAWTRANRARRG